MALDTLGCIGNTTYQPVDRTEGDIIDSHCEFMLNEFNTLITSRLLKTTSVFLKSFALSKNSGVNCNWSSGVGWGGGVLEQFWYISSCPAKGLSYTRDTNTLLGSTNL